MTVGEQLYELRSYKAGRQIFTHALTEEEARCLHIAAVHLANYLESQYGVGATKTGPGGQPSIECEPGTITI